MKRYTIVHKIFFAKEILILSLVLTSILLLAVEQFGHLSEDQLQALFFFDIVVGVLFIIDWLAELWLASDKRNYIRHNWFYLLAAIPIPNAFAQILRALRLIKIVKIIRLGLHYSYQKNGWER